LGLYEVGVFEKRRLNKALKLNRMPKVGVKYFRPNFIKPLLSAAAVFKAGSFKLFTNKLK